MENKNLYVNRLIAQGMSEEEATKFVELIENDVLESNGPEYYIRVSYMTGDSYGSYHTYDDVELGWKKLSIVKENIRRLIEENDLKNKIERAHKENDILELLKEWEKSDWAVTSKSTDLAVFFKSSYYKTDNDEYLIDNKIKLLKDDGSEFEVYTGTWHGYFEYAQEFSIETKEIE